MRLAHPKVFLCILLYIASSQPTFADATSDIKSEIQRRYDPQKTGRLTGDHLRVFNAHKADPVLKKYDVNNNGILDESELAALLADTREKYTKKPPKAVTGPATPDNLEDLARTGRVESQIRRGGIPLEDVIDIPKPTPDACSPTQSLYVRRDKLDTFLYGITAASKAQGASVSYTEDRLASKQSAAIDGFVGYALSRNPCIDPPSTNVWLPFVSAYVIAPWTDAHGTLSSVVPRTIKTEHSSLRSGFDFQVEISSGPVFELQYLTVSPYYQTDFRGTGSATGVTAAWQPFLLEIGLGGNNRRFSDVLDWYWQFQAQVDHKNVTASGLTSLTVGNQTWVGETTRLNVTFFPGEQFPEWIRNRFHFTGSYNSFVDTVSRTNANQGRAELAYNLVSDGSASVSFEYAKGRDKDTLVDLEQYLVKLNYKY